MKKLIKCPEGLKQGDRIEFRWIGSNMLYTGRIELRDGDSVPYFVNEHCYNGAMLLMENESMRYYNPLYSFGAFTYFKVICNESTKVLGL